MATSNPGNANLPIGAGASGTRNNPSGKDKSAIQENGAPSTPRWHSRGYLPHFESAEAIQHVTFHLADSLPQASLRALDEELKLLPAEKRHVERRKRIEAWIDAGHGSCILGKPEIAGMVQTTLLFLDSQRYRLLAWVVMPNHVHALFQPANGWTVAEIVASWKRYTAHKIYEYCRETGARQRSSIWHREYWDRYIRDERHFQQTVAYIHLNPVRAGLVAKSERWRWSSAFPANANLGNANPSIDGVNPGNANLLIGELRRKP